MASEELELANEQVTAHQAEVARLHTEVKGLRECQDVSANKIESLQHEITVL